MEKLSINTAEELKKQAEEIFQEAQKLENAVSLVRAAVSLVRAMDNLLYEVGCLYSAIDDTHAQAPLLKQHVADLISLSAILLPKFQEEVQGIYEKADRLSINALGIVGAHGN